MIEYTARITSQDTPRVGGRNLILGTTSEQKSLSWTDWYSSTNFKSVRGLTAGTYTLSFQLHSYEVQDREEGKLGVHMYVKLMSKDDREVRYLLDPFVEHSVLEGKYVCTFTIDDTDFDALWFRFRDMSPKGRKTISYSSIKLERGTVATDWTPAPEDVADSVTSLESKLLDPTTGEIHKLTDLLDKHKTDTDKNFAELSDHPLTIDDNGYWRIWDVKQQQYVTTQYKSRGENGQDAGRYLGRAKRIHPDFNGNYLLEPEGSSWQTAKEGDYVYLVGDLSNRGGDKDTYYIVREHKSKTVWEVYNIKGRTAHIEWHGTSLVVDDKPPVDLRGEAGHSPSPEEVLGTSRFAELLGGEVTSQIDPVAQDLATTNSNITRASNYAIDLINETQTQLCDLQVLGMSDGGVIEVKRQAACCHYNYPERIIGTDSKPPTIPKPKYVRAQIPLTLKSTHDALSRQVSNLQMQLTSCTQRLTATQQELDKLKADTAITPILNNTERRKYSSTRKTYGDTLYPQYGDWLLSSDTESLQLSFAGLRAEVGRSIYIQTRKQVYLNANGHTFFGLPGTSSSVAVNQMLDNNTTYRFLRADATTWLVTSSASPYPWT